MATPEDDQRACVHGGRSLCRFPLRRREKWRSVRIRQIDVDLDRDARDWTRAISPHRQAIRPRSESSSRNTAVARSQVGYGSAQRGHCQSAY